MDEDILVPFIVFASIASVFWAGFRYSASKRKAALDTVRAVVEKTGEASPELIQAIGADVIRKNEDLRKGMLLLAIGVAIIGAGALVSGELSGAVLGTALFPGLIGAVYVVFHFMNENDVTA
jgi:hypothetical protein